MMKSAYNVYRPVRMADGEGGVTENYVVTHEIYGFIIVHEAETLLHCDQYTDVTVEDIIEVVEDV
jgi:hypothetical protein